MTRVLRMKMFILNSLKNRSIYGQNLKINSMSVKRWAKRRKKGLELLIWLTCITVLIFIYIAVKHYHEEQELKQKYLKRSEKLIYSELSENSYYLEVNILESWREFYAHIYTNSEYMTNDDFYKHADRVSLNLTRTDNITYSSWENLKYNTPGLFMDDYVFSRLSETYSRQEQLLQTRDKFIKAHADLVKLNLKGSDALDLYDPNFFEFRIYMNDLETWINLMPQVYINGKFVLDFEEPSTEQERKTALENNPYQNFRERIKQFERQLLSIPPAKTTDSIKIKIREEIQDFAEHYNVNIKNIYDKLSPEEYTYVIEIKESKILVLARITDVNNIPLQQRTQIVTTIEHSLNALDFQEKYDYYIGVYSRDRLIMAATPIRKETAGIYANPAMLRPFYLE